jgi:hypothetical protein
MHILFVFGCEALFLGRFLCGRGSSITHKICPLAFSRLLYQVLPPIVKKPVSSVQNVVYHIHYASQTALYFWKGES